MAQNPFKSCDLTTQKVGFAQISTTEELVFNEMYNKDVYDYI